MREENKNRISDVDEDHVVDANWPKVLFYTYLQLFMVYGIALSLTEAPIIITLYSCFLIYLGFIGVTAGAHRLWAHNSYTATTTLKIFLMFSQTLIGQGSIYDWVQYHRLHHKKLNTDQDPFNPSRGFFYSHLICLLQKAPKKQEEWLKEVDMSDLENDKVVMFQKRYYWPICFLLLVITSIFIPCYYWKQSFLFATMISGFMRYGLCLHLSWLIHSATTIFALNKGEKYPADTNLVFLWDKTYWLHYHYLTPWDYQTDEFGKYGNDHVSSLIRVFAALELASNLRTISTASVQEALYTSMKTNKPISDCLLETEVNNKIPSNHYLDPKKYY